MDKMKKFEDYTIKELEQRIKDLRTPKVWLPYEHFWDNVEVECRSVGCNYIICDNIKSTPHLPQLNDQEQLELKLYLAQRAWKKEFDDVELDWENMYIPKYNICYSMLSNKYDIEGRGYAKLNMQIWFSTQEKAEQCLQWLRDSGVIK